MDDSTLQNEIVMIDYSSFKYLLKPRYGRLSDVFQQISNCTAPKLHIVVTRTHEDNFSTSFANGVTTHLRCWKTPFGSRFVKSNSERETLVYHTGDGWMQMTLTYWQRCSNIVPGCTMRRRTGMSPAL